MLRRDGAQRLAGSRSGHSGLKRLQAVVRSRYGSGSSSSGRRRIACELRMVHLLRVPLQAVVIGPLLRRV